MALEDIPEMQVYNEWATRSFDLDKKPLHYESRFIVVEHQDSPRKFVFSAENSAAHDDLECYFQEIARDKYDVEDTKRFKVSGGGFIQIFSDAIHFGGDSVKYGEHDRELVCQIIERWAKQYLPNHKIE